jgi:hypothetical protein
LADITLSWQVQMSGLNPTEGRTSRSEDVRHLGLDQQNETEGVTAGGDRL